jgi:osmoprotectant transport system ATP-binding protein
MSEPANREVAIEFLQATYEIPGRLALLADVTLSVQRGETLVLLGRSGAGKTTALKLINRLLDTTHGEVRVDGRSTTEWDAIELRRHIGYVVQEIGLFPHFTVERNIALVPRLEGWPKDRTRARVRELLSLVGLEPDKFLHRHPHQLSGGQRQRVGVARALAADPPILLMDEPFGALDPLTRGELQQEFQTLQKRLGKTIVIVTHDVGEALLLGTRIALVEAGRLTGVYTPKEFLRSQQPVAAAYAAQFRAYERLEGGV